MHYVLPLLFRCRDESGRGWPRSEYDTSSIYGYEIEYYILSKVAHDSLLLSFAPYTVYHSILNTYRDAYGGQTTRARKWEVSSNIYRDFEKLA